MPPKTPSTLTTPTGFWCQIQSLRDRPELTRAFADVLREQFSELVGRSHLELTRGFANVLREHSSELLDRSRTLQARSATLRSRAEALGAQKAGECGQDGGVTGASFAPENTALWSTYVRAGPRPKFPSSAVI